MYVIKGEIILYLEENNFVNRHKFIILVYNSTYNSY